MPPDMAPSDIIQFSLDIWTETGLMTTVSRESGAFYQCQRFPEAPWFNFFIPDESSCLPKVRANTTIFIWHSLTSSRRQLRVVLDLLLGYLFLITETESKLEQTYALLGFESIATYTGLALK